MIAYTRFFVLPALLVALTACNPGTQATSEEPPETAANEAPPEAEWLVDYEEAAEKSRETGRPILMNFTGSDWCPPCIQMKNDVLSTDRFLRYAEDNLVLLELDFPRRTAQEEALRQQNRQLANRFGIESFPTFVMVDSAGEEVRRTLGYMRGGPDSFISWMDG